MESENVKPKSKMSQRPKDTVKSSENNQSIPSSTKVKFVEKK